MEHRYGGNNHNSNYTFFADQARSAGYRGPELGGAPHEFFRDHPHPHHHYRPHPYPHHPHPHPLSHPHLRPPHPHAAHEAILREIEKEKIREEIIISEIARRRALEAEVRMELMMERELALQRGDDGFPFGSSPQVGFDPPTRLAITGTRLEGRSLEERIATPQDETRRLNGVRESGGFETLPFQRRAVDLRISEIKPVPEGGKEKILLLAKPNENTSGSKRKASTPPGADASEIPSDEFLKKKAKEEWSCALCKVNATCERALTEHLQGKKHKSKETALRAQGAEKNYTIGLLPKKAAKSIKVVTTSDPGAEEGVKFTGESSVSHKKNESELVKKLKNNDDHQKKKYNFWCEMCKVGTLSLKTMNNHKKGKKHVRRVEISHRNDGSHSKKIAIPVIHVKCDDVDGKDVTSERIDETFDETRVAADEPEDVFEPENLEVVDEMKGDHTTVDETTKDCTVVDEMKEECTALDEMKEDHTAVDEMKEDRTAGNEMKEDRTSVDEMKEDRTAVDKIKEDQTAVDEMKEVCSAVDKLEEDRTVVDALKGDRMDVYDLKGDRTDVYDLKGDCTAVDVA